MAIDGGNSSYTDGPIPTKNLSVDAHPDEGSDKSLIRSMVKPSALNDADEESPAKISNPHEMYNSHYNQARQSGMGHEEAKTLAGHKTFEQAAYGAGIGVAEDGPIIPITTRRKKGPKDIGRISEIKHGDKASTVKFESGAFMTLPKENAQKWSKGDILRHTKKTYGEPEPEPEPEPPAPEPPKPKLGLVKGGKSNPSKSHEE